jgi:hypothetical protein
MRPHLKFALLLLVGCCQTEARPTGTNAPTNVQQGYVFVPQMSSRGPVLKIDDAHKAPTVTKESRSTNSELYVLQHYRITACSNLVLDATGYVFKLPPAVKEKPLDSLVLRRTKAGLFADADSKKPRPSAYEMAWEAAKPCCELSVSALRPRLGSEPFEGFKPGETWLLSIGSTFKTNRFLIAWSGVIEVR